MDLLCCYSRCFMLRSKDGRAVMPLSLLDAAKAEVQHWYCSVENINWTEKKKKKTGRREA